jgi:predicted metal-dependent phosphoesterase TrpH
LLADLHLHSDHSDGRLDPGALVDVVADAGVRAFALTDHDTTGGHTSAQARAKQRGITFIPGIEMTTYALGRVIHVLALGCDSHDAGMRAANEIANDVWDANQRCWVDSLALAGWNVVWSKDFPDHPVRLPVLIGRLCRAGVDAGDPRRVYDRFRDFFDALPVQAYEGLLHPRAAAAAIRASGGLAILAHPFALHEAGALEPLLRECDGLEADYGRYAPEQREALRGLAARLGKCCTGGSDYHGYLESAYRPPGYQLDVDMRARLTLG